MNPLRAFADQTVGIVLPGNSVSTLLEHHAEFGHLDWKWGSVNRFFQLHDQLFKGSDQAFDCLFCHAQGELEGHLEAFHAYLRLHRNSVLWVRGDQHQRIMELEHWRELNVHAHNPGSGWPQPNSLLMLLELLLALGKPRQVVLFGADGYLGDECEMLMSYIGGQNLKESGRLSNVQQDTIYFNALIFERLALWSARLGEDMPLIWNVSPKSWLAGIPRLDYARLRKKIGGRLNRVQWARALAVETEVRKEVAERSLRNLDLMTCARWGLLGQGTELALHKLRSEHCLDYLSFRMLMLTRSGCEQAIAMIHNQDLEHLRWASLQLEQSLHYFDLMGPWRFALGEAVVSDDN